MSYKHLDSQMPYTRAKRELGISYLGSVAVSHKLELSKKNGTLTYGLYLAPADMSGYNVCPNSKWCKQFCLAGSGQNKIDELARGREHSRINESRVKKTRLFFENRELFMCMLIHEIERERKTAKMLKMPFSVRLNCTSDISPEDFVLDGKNILQIFPSVTFYDYTKVPSRLNLLHKYDNYDLTFSYNGHNWPSCEKFLKAGGRVAVVFFDGFPAEYRGYPVYSGDGYDMRYLDPAGIVGLTYHRVASDYKMVNGERVFVKPQTDFVVG